MGLKAKFNLVILAAFVVGLGLTAAYSWRLTQQSARQEVLQQASIMLASAIAIRNYTDSEIAPLLAQQNEVRFLPQTASFYAYLGLPVNLRGLGFDHVSATTEQHDGVPILIVEGNIVNKAGKAAEVPRLKLVVRNAARQEIYSWTAVPERNRLPPGEAVAFVARLASPPPEGRDVVVRFLNRRDFVTGMR